MSRTLRTALIAIAVVVAFTEGRELSHHTTTTTSTTSTTTTSTTSTTTTSTIPSNTTTSTASLTTCRGSQFSGANVGSQGAVGTGYDVMTLTNTAAGSCVIDGYPLVTLQEAHGVVESVSKMSDSTNFPSSPANLPPSPHTIGVGQQISIELRYSDVPVGVETCPAIVQVSVRFIQNDTSVPVTFPNPISPCVLEGIAVSPLYPS